MNIELDHVFVCGAPEAEEFVRFGLHEGLPNEPGLDRLMLMHFNSRVSEAGTLPRD